METASSLVKAESIVNKSCVTNHSDMPESSLNFELKKAQMSLQKARTDLDVSSRRTSVVKATSKLLALILNTEKNLQDFRRSLRCEVSGSSASEIVALCFMLANKILWNNW